MKNPQISTTVPIDTRESIIKLAQKEGRSLSDMASILLIQAIKERNRKKKSNAEKDHIEHYPTN